MTDKPKLRVAMDLQLAMDEYLRMRGEGVPQDQAVKGIEYILREAFGPPVPDMSTCTLCHDMGFERRWCEGRSSSCGRHRLHDGHYYVVRCRCRTQRDDVDRDAHEQERIAELAKTNRQRRLV